VRVLIDFVWENPEVPEGDSSWLWSRDIAKALTERGHFVYWVTPTRDGDGVLERVERLEATSSAREAEAIVPPSVAARWASPLQPLDAVLTNNPVRAMVLAQWLNTLHKGQVEIPVVVMNVSVKFPGFDELGAFGPRDLAMWAFGYAMNPNVMPSKFALERSRDAVFAYCGPALVAKYDETAVVEYLGPPTSVIDEVRQPKFERFSLYYGGRFTATKGGEDVVNAYVRFLIGGRKDADAYVTHVGMAQRLQEALAKYDARGLVNVQGNLGWRQAAALMSRCHASVFWQSMRMFPSTPFEQMYAGLAVMIRRDEWTDEFVPKEYPFQFESADELDALLRWVAENRDEAMAKIAWVPEWVKATYDRQAGIGRVLNRLEARTDELAASTVDGYHRLKDTRKVIAEAIETVGTPAPLGQVATVLTRMRPGMLRTHTTAKGLFMNELRRLWPPEYVDTCEDPEPMFVRTEVAS
jgi:hypothetical protein